MKITSILNEPKTINQIAKELGQERHTVAKKLSALSARGIVKKKVFGRSKIYSLSENPLIEALRKEDELSSELRSFLSKVSGRVSLHDKDYNILFAGEKLSGKCYEVFAQRDTVCPNCPASQVIEEGVSKTKLVSGLGEVKLHPLKDSKNNVVGILEVARNG